MDNSVRGCFLRDPQGGKSAPGIEGIGVIHVIDVIDALEALDAVDVFDVFDGPERIGGPRT